ncbi:MAG: DUF882 domain-containing protein [Gammaproteobacteria bacterium]|nr:MAG: DUF882 domain-containing protein [Gammaproteobacteria bacterium]
MPEKPEENSRIKLSRRSFLTTMAGAAITLTAPAAIASAVPARDRELSFYNTHTGEKLTAAFWSDGNYLDDGIEEINWILRDHRTGIARPIDPKLLDLLHQLQATVEHAGEFHVISGYRSPATNAMLNKHSSGVAKHSYHMLGKAIDVRLPDFDTGKLHKAAVSLKRGGVGYYARSNFIHLDVGRVRYW